MKKITIFIVIVLLYSLLELCVGLALMITGYRIYSVREPLLSVLLLLLVPGLAAIFSGFRYSSITWRKRALVTFLLGVVGFPVLTLGLFFYTALVYLAFEAKVILGVLVACILLALILWPVRLIVRSLRRWDLRLEESSWLSGIEEYRVRQRAIRWALWIPSITVATFLVFLSVVRHCFQSSGARGRKSQ